MGRYLCLTLIFSLSGVLHVLAEYGGGRPFKRSGTMRFFLTQVLGIIIEDGVGMIKILVLRGKESYPKVEKLIGYIWVILFLIWSTPAWLYPDLSQSQTQPFLPFSFFKLLLYSKY